MSSLSDRFSRAIQDSVRTMLGILILIVLVPVAACLKLVEYLSPSARERARRCEAAWQGFTDPGPDGYSRLQRECHEIVTRFVSENGYNLNEEVRESFGWKRDGEWHGRGLTLRIEELETTVWLDLDQVALTTPEHSWAVEFWDTESPADMERWLTEELNALVRR